MANTNGFEVVIEAAEPVLKKFLRGAWKSAECPGEPGDDGRIPEYMDIPDDTGPVAFGAYVVDDGQIQIPEDELDAKMAPDVNGTELKLGLHVQVEIQNPPVPSAGFLEMTADVRAKTPMGTLPGSNNVGLLLAGLPRANVSVALTSGHPLSAKLLELITEYIHARYEDETIPHNRHETGRNVGPMTVDLDVQIYDDQTDPARRINVSLPNPTTIEISIPIYLRMYNIQSGLINLADPMGVTTRLIVTAPFESPPGSYTARLSDATVTVQQPLTPAEGIEGTNYTANKGIPFIGGLLEPAIVSQLEDEGTVLAQGIGDSTIEVPTIAEIEQAIGDFFHQELESRDFISFWMPESVDSFNVDDVTVKALNDALVIALNAGGGANVNAMTNFIPAGRDIAIALSGSKTQEIIDQARLDEGMDDASLPKRFNEGGKDVDLTELDVFLTSGAIRMEGEVTVIDAILGSIDVDADFWVKVGLRWEPNAALNADGVQMMEHVILDKDVDPEESVAFWIISIILAIISFGAAGLIGLLIVVIIIVIVKAIAESIGSSMLTDPVSGALNGITAWPPELSKIGTAQAIFHDPITIDTSGLVMSGMLEVISSCEDTDVLGAHSGSAYSVQAASDVLLAANATLAGSSYTWLAGDGSSQAGTQDKFHTYVASGLYIAKHSLTINQPGGARSRHFALVKVENVPPTVDAGPDITVNEGQVVELVGHFKDVEYPDVHESTWHFGDSQPIQGGVISQTNTPPQAEGTSRVEHAWCDNGTYIVTLMVRDQNGGIGTDTRTVTVLNVPPRVDAGPDMFAYPCTVITLSACFEDPGWCDTHTGEWELGDCTPPQMAIIHEVNEAPAARGEALVSHVYERCGDYHVRITVTDDDGGAGQDTLVVRVVDIKNAGFEEGFRLRRWGSVANDWQPYALPLERDLPGTSAIPTHQLEAGQVFGCEQCIVHSGQRAQCISLPTPARAGITQKIGANPGWDYHISVWYALAETAGGRARLGVDPSGGVDPTSSSIVWAEGNSRLDWAQLAVRVTATGRAITIFLELRGDLKGPAQGCFDDVALRPIQPFCTPESVPLPPPPEPEPEPRGDRCVDFTDEKPETEMPAQFTKEGFVFRTLDGQTRRIVTYGDPQGDTKLELGMGMFIDFPFTAQAVRVRFGRNDGWPVDLVAIDNAGNITGQTQTPPDAESFYALTLTGANYAQIQLTTKSRETTLYDVCIRGDGQGMTIDRRDKEQVRAVLARHQDAIISRYNAAGVGIGKVHPTDEQYVITVYIEKKGEQPKEQPDVEGVPLMFVVSGAFKIQ
jgi:hypothetical protein